MVVALVDAVNEEYWSCDGEKLYAFTRALAAIREGKNVFAVMN